MSLAVHVVGPRRRILELQRTIVVLPSAPNGLKEHQWVSRSVAQLVLGEVRRNRVRPGRELLRAIEAVQVAMDANKNFLHQVFSTLAISHRAIDEIEQPSLI